MKPREYCCCAIPLVNTGIYIILVEQSIAGILVGALSVGTPSIVGAATPSSASGILAAICFVAAATQLLGFIGVLKERPTLYRRYVALHGLLLSAAFSVAAAWIIISATRHSTALSNCVRKFFPDPSQQSQGETLCDIFPWVDVGIMGGLWVLLALLQGYLLFVLSSYGASQRRDHRQYDILNDSTQPLTKDSIPMTDRNDPWDTRLSGDPAPDNGGYEHSRNISTASASDVINQPYQRPANSLSSDYGFDTSRQHEDTRDRDNFNYNPTSSSNLPATNNYYLGRS